MATLLAKKSGPEDNAIATDDEHHEAMASDPHITVIPQGSTFGGNNAFTNTQSMPTTFGSPQSTGFGSPSSFGSSGSGFGSTPAVTNSFGSQPLGNGSNIGNQQPVTNLTAGAEAAVKGGAESTVALDKDATDWINKKMRPMMGWIYMLTCTCDFVLFPILWSVLQALTHGNVTSQWQPVTLQGAGLYHIAMGAILGIAAYGRTKEKVAGVA